MARLRPGEYEVEGLVLEALPNLTYRIQIVIGPSELVGQELLATVSGQMKMFRIRVMPGDGVKVLMTQYDKSRGRITFRLKDPRALQEQLAALQTKQEEPSEESSEVAPESQPQAESNSAEEDKVAIE